MGPLMMSILGGLLRYALAGVITWLISNGIATPEQTAELITGIAGGLALLVWMIWRKYRDRVRLLTGLAAPKGTSVDKLKDMIARGVAVPAATTDHQVPVTGTGDGAITPPRSAAWLLPLLLVGGLTATGCAGLTQAPVITGEDQATVRKAASKALGAIEIAGVIVRDGQDMAIALGDQGVLSASAVSSIKAAVIAANTEVQSTITQIDAATRLASVESLAAGLSGVIRRVADALRAAGSERLAGVASALEAAVVTISIAGRSPERFVLDGIRISSRGHSLVSRSGGVR